MIANCKKEDSILHEVLMEQINENASIRVVPVHQKAIEGALGRAACWNSFGHRRDGFHGVIHYFSRFR